MPRIKMLRDARGSDDGFQVKAFLSQQEYEVGDSLAVAFVDQLGVARRVGAAGVVDTVKAVAAKVVEALTLPPPVETPPERTPEEISAAAEPPADPAPPAPELEAAAPKKPRRKATDPVE